MRIPNLTNREHVANFRKGRRRVDFYVASSVIPYLEYLQAQHPGDSLSAIINGAITFAYQRVSGNGKATT